MTAQQERKRVIRQFMRDHYDDEHLAMLLVHAQKENLSYCLCCCFVGMPAADLVVVYKAEESYIDLASRDFEYLSYLESETIRRRILIPMIRAEFRRREKARAAERQSQGSAMLQLAERSI